MASPISLHTLLVWALCLGLGLAALADLSQTDVDSGKALSGLNKRAYRASLDLLKYNTYEGCTKETLRVRKEWRALSKRDRTHFIAAMKCMKSKPSVYPEGQVPGSKSLYDDFVAVHIIQTPYIHLSATFLTWHRYFIWTFEKELNKCGYKGTLPYWEWGLDVENITASAVFDGTATSLGGNGAPVEHGDLFLPQPGAANSVVRIPAGEGGGCVTAGPFGALEVRLGPAALPVYGTSNITAAADPLADNPRCLKRDLGTYPIARWASFLNTTRLLLDYDSVELFQAYMGGDPRYELQELGVHGGGHFAIGGDPGTDLYVSPGDPAFWVHHGQIDRVYWIWQMLDFEKRQNVWGTNSSLNNPPTANVTVDDYNDLSPVSGPVQIKALMNTVGGSPLCYVYV